MTEFRTLIPDLQVSFYYRLREIEARYFGEALRKTVERLDIRKIDTELSDMVAAASLRKVAGFGLRGELLFPVPSILTTNPYLLGYYRLLYGFSQKDFYSQGPFGIFAPLEERGEIKDRNIPLIIPICQSLIKTGEILVDSIDFISSGIIHSLQLLTFGAFLRGSFLNKKGKDAVGLIYNLIHNIVEHYIITATKRLIIIRNDSDRIIHLDFMNDPDIRIQGMLPSGTYPILAVEIKGGTDVSNVYNRLGESEKSHRTARSLGFAECWTIINARLDLAKAKQKSPSTTQFFYLFEISDSSTPAAQRFKEQFCTLLGIRG